MRIAMVTSSYPNDAQAAAGQFVCDMEQALNAAGHRVTVFAAPSGAGTIRHQPSRAARWLFRLSRQQTALANAELVLTHWPFPHALCIQHPNQVGLFHSSEVRWLEYLPKTLSRGLCHAVAERCAHMIFTHEGLRQRFFDLAGVNFTHTSVAPMGVADELFDLSRQTAQLQTNTLRPLWIARNAHQKHPEHYLSIARALPNLRFTMAIDRAPTDVPANVDVVPFQFGADKYRLLAEHNVFLLTSSTVRPEGVPVAMLEAMAAGLAVLATGSGGATEWLKSAHGLMCVTPADFVEALIQLSGAPSQIAARGQAARHAVRRLAWPQHINAFLPPWPALAGSPNIV